MKFGKRQIILGALILALGSAVYLNWQFGSVAPVNKDIPTTGEVSTDEIEDENLGIAQLVNNSYVETVNDEVPAAATNSMTDARLARQTARDEAIQILDDVLKDVEADSDSKKAAVDESAKIAQTMLKETTAESLLKAKGIDNSVVFMSDSECNVIVEKIGDNTLIIQEIVTEQTGLTVDKIHIIEAE